jgi:MFS family permease
MAVAEVEATPRLSEEYKRKRTPGLFAFAIGQVGDSAEGGLINTLFPVIMEALSLPLGALGQLSSVSKFARMIFGTLWAIVADKIGRKLVLVVMTGIWGLWTCAAGLSQNYTQLLILYAIGAIGTVAAEPITNGILTDMYEDDERGKAYGLLRSVSVLAGLVVTPLIGQLANVNNGWRIGMFILGGFSVLTGILIAIFVHEPPRRVVEGKEASFKFSDIGKVLKIPTVWLIAVSLLLITSMVFFAFMVTFLVKVRGWTTPQAAVLYTVFMLGFGISGYFGGTLGDLFEKKFGPKGRVMMMQIYLVAFGVMVFLMTQINWGQSPIFYVIVFLTGLVGSLGFSGCVLPMVGSILEPQYAATGFALLFSFIQGLITAIYLLFVGPLSKALGSMTAALLWMVVVPYLVNAVWWFTFYFTYPKDVAKRKARMAGQKV